MAGTQDDRYLKELLPVLTDVKQRGLEKVQTQLPKESYRAILERLTLYQQECVLQKAREAREKRSFEKLFLALDANHIEALHREYQMAIRFAHTLEEDRYLTPEQTEEVSMLLECALLDWLKRASDCSAQFLADIQTAIERTESNHDFDVEWTFEEIEFYLRLGVVKQETLDEALQLVMQAGDHAKRAKTIEKVETFQIFADVLASWGAGMSEVPESQQPQKQEWFTYRFRIKSKEEIWYRSLMINSLLYLHPSDLERTPDGLHPDIGNLTNLTLLHLPKSYLIKTLPNSIGNLTNLTTLKILYSHLKTLPESIGNLTNLTELNLDDNELQILPESIGNLTNLTELNLNHSELRILPDSFANLSNLTTLHLERSNLQILPDNFGNLISLVSLTLSHSNVKLLPESFSNLSHLEMLNLENNDLQFLPDNFGNLSHLKTLNLRSSRLKTLPESIGNLTHLTELNLRGNDLETLPESIGNLTHLNVLNLGDNHLKTLPESFGKLTNLTKLYIERGSLKTLPESFSHLTNLKILNLEFNELQILPESIGNFSNLAELNLEFNYLEALPQSFDNWLKSEFVFLRLNGNPLCRNPVERQRILKNKPSGKVYFEDPNHKS